MSADRRNAAWLIVAAILGWCSTLVGAGTAVSAVSSAPESCHGVVCPQEKCPGHLTYRHGCCELPVCSCFDRQEREFRAINSRWTSADCRSSCQCVKALDSVSFKYKLDIKCSPLRCPAAKSGCQKGLERCCSVCKIQPSGCYSPELGRSFKDGAMWKPSPCRDCTCVGDRAICTHTECRPLSCPPGQTPKTLTKECCPSYCRNSGTSVSPYKSCREHGGNRSFPHLSSRRPQWPCSPLTCTCRHGGWECDNRTAACPSTCLGNRTVSLGRPGQCCPLCVGKMSCHVGNGEYRYAGRVWMDYVKKQQCACIHGVVECLDVPISALPTSHPPSSYAPTLVPWMPILLVVLGVLVLFFALATAFVLRDRCDSRACALVNFGCWPRSSATNGAGKSSFAMHYKKGAEAEVMIGDFDENGNQRPTEAFA